jgi:hypothetical protein
LSRDAAVEPLIPRSSPVFFRLVSLFAGFWQVFASFALFWFSYLSLLATFAAGYAMAHLLRGRPIWQISLGVTFPALVTLGLYLMWFGPVRQHQSLGPDVMHRRAIQVAPHHFTTLTVTTLWAAWLQKPVKPSP